MGELRARELVHQMHVALGHLTRLRGLRDGIVNPAMRELGIQRELAAVASY